MPPRKAKPTDERSFEQRQRDRNAYWAALASKRAAWLADLPPEVAHDIAVAEAAMIAAVKARRHG